MDAPTAPAGGPNCPQCYQPAVCAGRKRLLPHRGDESFLTGHLTSACRTEMTAMAERTWDVNAAQAAIRGSSLTVLALRNLDSQAGPEPVQGLHQRASDGLTTGCPFWLLGWPLSLSFTWKVKIPRASAPHSSSYPAQSGY